MIYFYYIRAKLKLARFMTWIGSLCITASDALTTSVTANIEDLKQKRGIL